jgi:hypothetical protein
VTVARVRSAFQLAPALQAGRHGGHRLRGHVQRRGSSAPARPGSTWTAMSRE